MKQLIIDFNCVSIATNSPINQGSITGQNNILKTHLDQGLRINMVAAKKLGIETLHSRIAEMRKIMELESEWITVNSIRCKSYWKKIVSNNQN